MNCYAVIDTNVLVSALLTTHEDAATIQVIVKIIDGTIIPLCSEAIFKEYTEVLQRRKFHFSKDRIEKLLAIFKVTGIFISPKRIDYNLPDSKDIPFYEVVMDKRKTGAYLVTGNLKHFPRQSFIVTPRELLGILRELKLRR